jgi:hypothetical protein
MLFAMPSSLSFQGLRGKSSPPAQSISIYNQGSASLAWTATKSASWLTLSHSSGSTPSTLSVGVDYTALAPGTYSGTVTINAGSVPNSPQTVSVTLVVSELLLASDFNDNSSQGWVVSPLGGAANWSVVNQALRYNGGGHAQLFAGNSAWTDYRVEADIKLNTLSNYPGGIRGRVNPSTGAAYSVWLYPAQGLIRLWKHTSWNIDVGLVQLGATAAASFDTQSFHKVALSFQGNQIQVFYDGSLVISATDSTYASGMVALDVHSQVVLFDNILVTASTQPPVASLALSSNSLSFSGTYQGPNPATQTVQLASSGTGLLAWTAVSTVPWLAVSPGSGTGAVTLQVSSNMSQLAGGNYDGAVRVTSPAASNNPQIIEVDLTVVIPPPFIVLSPSSMNFITNGQSGPTPRVLSVANGSPGSGSFAWTAAANSPWLGVSPLSGNTPGSASVSVNAAGLAAGTYSGQVTVAASGVQNSPQTLPVTFSVFSPVMNETFSNLAKGWMISPMGKANGWTVSNGVYAYSGIGLSQTCAGNSAWTDYSFSAEIRLSSLQNWPGGVRGRVNPATGAGYVVWLYPQDGKAILYRVPQWYIDGPGLVSLAEAPLSFDTNNFHELQMVFQESNISVYWDGVLLMMAADNSYASGFACLDGANRPISYRDIQVNAVQPPANIAATPTSVVFAAAPGAPPPQQNVNIDAGGATTAWGISISTNTPWLSATVSSSLTPATITLSANPSSLAEGVYNGSITLFAPGATNSPLVIPVTMGVRTAITGVAPPSLTFFAATGATASNQNLTVTNQGAGTLSWTATKDSSWIGLNPASGIAPSPIAISANAATLPTGSYTGEISVASTNYGNPPVAVPVTFEVGTSLLLSDNFNSGSAAGWTISPLGQAAGWSVNQGTYAFNGQGHTQAWAGSPSWTDYTIAVDFRLSSLSNFPGGIRGRVNTSTGASYGVWIYPQQGLLRLYRITQWHIDAPGLTLLSTSAPLSMDTVNWHNLRLSFKGSQIRVYYDNALVLEGTDSVYGQGAVALDVSNQPISFDNAMVIGF